MSKKQLKIVSSFNEIEEEMSKFDLFLKLANYNSITKTSRIVSVIEFEGEFSSLKFNNGGDWCRRSAVKDKKLATMKKNGTISCLWDADEEEEEMVRNEFKKCPISTGNSIQFMKVFGLKEIESSRPIRQEIKKHYQQMPCCVCGSMSELVCDHKNDLYNDPRVLSTETQTLEDFQSLCNHCNLQKRQISKLTRKTGKRHGATNIPTVAIFGVDFISGTENYDPEDINAMKGTYWYDPIEFMENIKSSLLKPKNNISNVSNTTKKEMNLCEVLDLIYY